MAIGGLALTEALQGFGEERVVEATQTALEALELVALNVRRLRATGITVSMTIDALAATRCLLDGRPFLYAGRAFDPVMAHLGLPSAMAE